MAFGALKAAAVAATLALTGCAADDLMVKRVTESEARVELLIQTGRKGELRDNELSGRLLAQEEQGRLLAGQISQLQETIRELRAAGDELKARLALVSQQAATPKVEVVNPEPAPRRAGESGPPADYVKAFGLYSANNFPAAIAAFESFVSADPAGEYVPNALYWIGECHYSLNDLPRARDSFKKVVDSHGKSPKAPDAMLKLGYTLLALKEQEQAAAVFESLIRIHPSSPAAAKARERLTAN